MDSHARSTLLWGTLAILLFALVAAGVFCEATEGILQAEACGPVLIAFRRLTQLIR
jgi:hypothetical protein